MATAIEELRIVLQGDTTAATAALGQTGQEIASFSEKAGKLGKATMLALTGAAVTAGVAIGAALTKGLTDYAEFDQVNDKLAAQLDLSAEEAARAGELAGKVYAGNYGESMEEVSNTIGTVISSIEGMRSASDEVLQSTTQDALNFASVYDTDVTQAVQTVGQLIQNGLAKDSKEGFDLMTAAFREVPAAMREELPMILQEYGTNFRALGFDGQEAFALLVSAAGKGQFALDKTGDALKEYTILVGANATAQQEAFASINLDANEMAKAVATGGDAAQEAVQKTAEALLKVEDPVGRANAAIALFGAPLEDLSVDQIPAFLQGLTGASEGLENVAGAAERSGTKIADNAGSRIEAFKRTMQIALVDFVGDSVIPVATQLYDEWVPKFRALFEDEIQPLLERFANWWAENKTSVVDGIISVAEGLLNAAVKVGEAIGWAADHWDTLGPILEGVSIVIGAVLIPAMALYAIQSTIAAVTSVAAWVTSSAAAVTGAATIAASWAVAAGPVVLLIAAFVAVGVALGFLVALVVEHWDSITSAIGTAIDWIVEGFTNGIMMLGQLWLQYTPIGQMVADWDTIVGAVRAAVAWIVEGWTNGVRMLGEIWMRYSPVGAIIRNWDTIVQFFATLVIRITATIMYGAQQLYNAGRNIVKSLADGIKSLLSSPVDAITNLGKSMINAFKRIFGINSPSRVGRELTQYIGEGMALGYEDMAGRVQSAADMLNPTLAGGSVELGTLATSGTARSGMASSTTSTQTWTGDLIISGAGDPAAVAREVRAQISGIFGSGIRTSTMQGATA